MLNLIELFQALDTARTTGSEDRFSAIPIPGYGQHRLGKDAQGHPLLLISVLEDRSQREPDPIFLEHLTVEYNLGCRVSRPDGTSEEELFTVVRCINADTTLQTYFLKVAASIIISLKDQSTHSDVAHAVNQLIELFRAMAKPPRKSVQGLWAELFLISQARQPAILVDAWHTDPRERYDFAMDEQRIEVKSFSGQIRQHHFSFEQLHPPEGVKVLVASVHVESSQAGESIDDLRQKIRDRLEGNLDALLHIDTTIALTLGDGWHRASEERFDQGLAAESLAFYEASAIPSVDPNLPTSVSDVRFRSNLTEVAPAEVARYLSGRMFNAAFR